MAKDNVDLICSIGELAVLFEKTSSLDGFLGKVVNTIAYHMKAAVCSVYLFDDDSQQLVLAATQGLNPEFVRHVRMNPGEGLVGQAFANSKSVREADGRQSPYFKLVPGLNEESYRAFLAVPLLRGLSRIGVLVVQDPVADYFSENDEKALRAIASQLAVTIENARLLIGLREKEPKAPTTRPREEMAKFIKGTSASGGCALGTAVELGRFDPAEYVGAAGRHLTLEDFTKAVAMTEQQIEALQHEMEERLSDVASLIFSAHLLILKDESFSGAMADRIRGGEEPFSAVHEVVEGYAALFSRSQNAALREKTQDVRDLGRRLLHNLVGGEMDHADYNGCVVVCADLMPSDMLKVVGQRAAGLLLAGGGVTSHVSIIARSLRVPMVIVSDRRVLDMPSGTRLLLDGDQGTVFINPEETVLKNYGELDRARVQAEAAEKNVRPETFTRDGRRVHLLANINLLSDLPVALRLKAEGIGLYRSEFPFIVRNDFPSEEEQYVIYRRIVREMGGREVVFRTLDIGGDKILSYFPTVNESNPFLGLRAIRFSLRHREIFERQLRALLRAGEGVPIRIMFPLVSSVDDLVEARDILRDCARSLAEAGIPHQPEPEVGVMMELPSAVEIADDLADEADFLCIGSNDLVQYILAVDRTNEHIADLYVPYHPAVLRALKRIVDAATKQQTDLSICGDMATDPRLIPFLLGIGLTKFSMDSRRLPQIQEVISGTDFKAAQAKAESMLLMRRVNEVAAFLGYPVVSREKI